MILRPGHFVAVAILAVGGLALVCPRAHGQNTVSRNDLTRKECAICHIGRLDATEPREKPFEQHPWQPLQIKETLQQASNGDMCYSCHDGYVRDSRQRVWEGQGHSVGRVPSPAIVLPSYMPLDARGTVYCGTCHTPHGLGEKTAELTDSVFLRLENVDSRLCTECHVRELEGMGRVNHPVNQKAAQPLSEEVFWLGGRLGSDPRKIICQSCHTPHGRGTLLKPASDDSLCLMCHADRAGSVPFLKAGRPQHPVGMVPRHDLSGARVNSYGARWGRGRELICMTCHGIHDGRAQAMVLDPEPSGFCQGCHPDSVRQVSFGFHDLSRTAPGLALAEGETPLSAGSCRICHRAHGWARHPQAAAESLSLMCLDCHREGGFTPQSSVGSIFHPVGEVLTEFRGGEVLKPLLWKGKRIVVCSTCHEPHGIASRFRGQVPEGASGKGVDRVSLRTEEPELCRACHLDHFTVEGTKHDLTAPARIAQIEEKVGPVEERHPCIPCHRVHKARASGLWFVPVPEAENSFEADQGSRKCLLCHRHEAFGRIQEKNGHPISKPMKTQYLPSAEAQLRLGRIAPDKAGVRDVVVCATCHLNHGRKSPDGSITLYAGGGVAGGDLCIACHRENAAIIGSPHDFRHIKEGGYRPDNGRSLRAGVCEGCHVNHDALIEKGLIAFVPDPPQEEGNPEDMFCLHCHLDPRVTDPDRVKFYIHPSAARVREILAKRGSGEQGGAAIPGMRLGEPGRTSSEGYDALFRIKCTTCHDNHRWTQLSADEALAAANTEMTSFLRSTDVAETVCANCHGEQGLYLYRFFHQGRAFRLRIQNR